MRTCTWMLAATAMLLLLGGLAAYGAPTGLPTPSDPAALSASVLTDSGLVARAGDQDRDRLRDRLRDQLRGCTGDQDRDRDRFRDRVRDQLRECGGDKVRHRYQGRYGSGYGRDG